MQLVTLIRTGLLAGITLFSIGALLHLAVPFLFPALKNIYDDHSALFRTWPGWTETCMIAYPFAYGFLFAFGFQAFHATKKESIYPGVKGGIVYGMFVFAMGFLPVYLLNYISLRVPGIVIASWAAQSLLQLVTTGALLGWATDGALLRATVKCPPPADEIGKN